MAAYQFEFLYDASVVSIIGIEGGERPFHESPYFDPAGLKTGRVVAAAFTLAEESPIGRVRVARIHFLREGEPARPFEGRLIAAAAAAGAACGEGVELLLEDPSRLAATGR